MNKRLTRSNDRVWAGVCGGIAEYLDFDPVMVRIAYAFLTLFTAFSGLIFYFVLWIKVKQSYQSGRVQRYLSCDAGGGIPKQEGF